MIPGAYGTARDDLFFKFALFIWREGSMKLFHGDILSSEFGTVNLQKIKK